MIPYGKQDINQADIEAVIAVLKSDFLTQGPQVPLFEKKYLIIVMLNMELLLIVPLQHYILPV